MPELQSSERNVPMCVHISPDLSMSPFSLVSYLSLSSRHAELMKKIMTMMGEDGRELEVHSYPPNTVQQYSYK